MWSGQDEQETIVKAQKPRWEKRASTVEWGGLSASRVDVGQQGPLWSLVNVACNKHSKNMSFRARRKVTEPSYGHPLVSVGRLIPRPLSDTKPKDANVLICM